MDNDQIRVLLTLPADTKYFEEYKEAYLFITGKPYRGTCGKCGIRSIYKLMQRHINNLN